MGYDTEFSGSFQLDKPLTATHKAYLEAFADSRRIKRHVADLEKYPDPLRVAVDLPLGIQGEYFVGTEEGVDGPSIADYNHPPSSQPGLNCQWIPNADGTAIEWDEGEKFCEYIEWLEYIIKNFLTPWGYVLNGKVSWYGEENSDQGVIHVKNNKVQAIQAKIVQDEPDWEEE